MPYDVCGWKRTAKRDKWKEANELGVMVRWIA